MFHDFLLLDVNAHLHVDDAASMHGVFFSSSHKSQLKTKYGSKKVLHAKKNEKQIQRQSMHAFDC